MLLGLQDLDFNKKGAPLYEIGSMMGLGNSIIPIRINNTPELVIVELNIR